MIGFGIVGGFRGCYFCGVMEKVRWQWAEGGSGSLRSFCVKGRREHCDRVQVCVGGGVL